MRRIVGMANFCFTAAAVIILVIIIQKQGSEIASLKSEMAGLNDKHAENAEKLVSHSLEIVNYSGKVVASIEPDSPAQDGAQLILRSFSPSGESSSVYLLAQNIQGPSFGLFRDKKPGLFDYESWVGIDTDGFNFGHGDNLDRKHPNASASLKLSGATSFFDLVAHDVGKVQIGVGGIGTVFPDGKAVTQPAGLFMTALRGDEYEAPSIDLNLEANRDGTSSPNLQLIASNWKPQANFSATGIGFTNRDLHTAVNLRLEDDSGKLELYDRSGTSSVLIGTNKTNDGYMYLYDHALKP